jgi:hypothetical protein
VSRRKRPEHSNHERWLVSYADFITLLFAFFVVLYSSAQVDQRKAGKLAKAIQTDFAQMGAFDSTSNRPQVLKPEDPALSNFRAVQEGHAFETLKGGQDVVKPSNLEQIQKDLQASLAREISARTVSVTATREGIVVSLRELGFFDSGSTALQPDAISTLGNFLKVAGPLQAAFASRATRTTSPSTTRDLTPTGSSRRRAPRKSPSSSSRNIRWRPAASLLPDTASIILSPRTIRPKGEPRTAAWIS